MLFFFHLFTGIILGLLIGDLVQDHRWDLPVIMGGVLPDLIDKPIGYIYFADIFGNGRIFFHSLVLFFVLVITGLLIWKRWERPEVLAIAIGILSHQILDMMWETPKNWFFPLLGSVSYKSESDYAFVLLENDASAKSEWIFAAAIVVLIVLFFVIRRDKGIISRHRRFWAMLMAASSLIFVALAGAAIGTVLLPGFPFPRLYRMISFFNFFRLFRWHDPVQFIIGGFVFLFSALLFWRLRARLMADEKEQAGSGE